MQEADPTNKWLEEASGLQNEEHVEELNERGRTENNGPPPIGQLENNSPLSSEQRLGEQRQDENRELDFLIRERDLMRRELELARREVELLRNSPSSLSAQQQSRYVNVNTIKDLIGDFDGSDVKFRNWKERFELLCDTYELDDANGRLLISLKLKGRAQKWLHSKTELIGMTLPNLLTELGNMFDHRQNKLDLRRKFEARTWKVSEPFNEYFHEKIILANAASVD